jgi:hypothetical protein
MSPAVRAALKRRVCTDSTSLTISEMTLAASTSTPVSDVASTPVSLMLRASPDRNVTRTV